MNGTQGLQTGWTRTLLVFVGFLWCLQSATAGSNQVRYEYKVLATNKTSTMEKELNESGDRGFRFAAVMGGETTFGGSEVVVIMQKEKGREVGRFQYKLLATSRTSTMQKEIQEASDQGFRYRGQTVFETAFGGKETVVIMERDGSAGSDQVKYEYKLLATNKTSTMQEELSLEGENGFELVGMTVGNTRFGAKEMVSILKRRVR